MAREPIGKDAADDVEVRLKALQKLEASIDVITTTTMVAKVDKALQAFGGGSPDPQSPGDGRADPHKGRREGRQRRDEGIETIETAAQAQTGLGAAPPAALGLDGRG